MQHEEFLTKSDAKRPNVTETAWFDLDAPPAHGTKKMKKKPIRPSRVRAVSAGAQASAYVPGRS